MFVKMVCCFKITVSNCDFKFKTKITMTNCGFIYSKKKKKKKVT